MAQIIITQEIREQLTHLSAVVMGSVAIYDGTGFLYVTDETTNVFFSDRTFLNKLYSEQKQEACLWIETETVYYGILWLDAAVLAVAGPFTNQKLERAYVRQYAGFHKITEISKFHIHIFSYLQAASYLQTLYYTCRQASFPGTVRLPETDIPQGEQTHSRLFSQQNFHIRSAEEELSHHPYQLEACMFDLIKDGDMEGIQKLFTDPAALQYSTGTMSFSPQKQAEYTTVTAIHLFTTAAIAGGANPYDAYDLSDACLQKLSRNTSADHAQQVFLDAILDYLKLVNAAKREQNTSIHVKKSKHYILRHLNRPFSYEELAAYVGVNQTYLSTLFHETEGITIRGYLTQERIRAAKNMLKYSDYSITRIAEYLDFQSVSYFGVIFKKQTGLTPREYRRQKKPQGF